MRIVTWNCCGGGFRKKAARMAALRPDVLVVQEVEKLDNQLFLDGDQQPTFLWRTPVGGSIRGLALLSYSGVELRPAFDESRPLHGFYPFEARWGDLEFRVVGVWTFETRGSPRTSYRQAHDGLDKFAEWLVEKPSVILGDFNANASYKDGGVWQSLWERLEALGFASAYHQFVGEPFGAENRPTHYHKGHESARSHLDYCFIPAAWKERLRHVDVGDFASWQGVSDHRPVVVDLDVGAPRL
jgi:exonuclease III